MSEPVLLRDILRHLCACGRNAAVRYEAGHHGGDYRAIQTCTRCAPRARTWAARAGPVRETRLAPDQPPETREENPSTLF